MLKGSSKISTFKIAATYVGTVIGAGFTSGQEILQFFGSFGNKGLAGLLIVTVFFIIYGSIIMELGYTLQSTSYLEIIRLTGGKYFGIAADFIMQFFLFGTVAAMIAASGALFYQHFNIHSIIGGIIMTSIIIITVFMGINGLINSLSIIIPILLIVTIGTSITALFFIPPPTNNTLLPSTANPLLGNWLRSAILYLSYNIVTSVAVLGPLGKGAKDTKTIRLGAFLGGLSLGICAFVINLAMGKYIGNLSGIELPMVFITGKISPFLQTIYSIVLLAAIFTTSAGSLYGFAARLFDVEGPKGRTMVPVIAILAFLAGQFGFSNLVKYMYPLEGYLGVIMLIGLFYSKVKMKHFL